MDVFLAVLLGALVLLVLLFVVVLRLGSSQPRKPQADSGDDEAAVREAGARLLRRRRPRGLGEMEGEGEGKEEVQSAKQLKKAEKAAEKARLQQLREAEREMRQKDDAAFWAQREKLRKEELARLAYEKKEEERLAEEMERRQQEEFEAWKDQMEVEDDGGAAKTPEQLEAELEQFVQSVKQQKVILLEALASEWNLTVTQVLERLAELETAGRLCGVVDERGMYIYVTPEELEALANFIQTKGRISISRLAEASTRLINLEPV